MTPTTRMIIDALTPRAFWTTYRFQGHGSDDWWVEGEERAAIERGDYETRVHKNAVGTFWQYLKVSG